MSGAPTVEAEDEFVEVGLEMLAAQPVIDAQGPDLEVGEDPMNPREHDVGGHLPTTMGSWVMPAAPGYPGQPSVLAVAPEVTLAARKAWRLAAE
jgi:hypothetical protein